MGTGDAVGVRARSRPDEYPRPSDWDPIASHGGLDPHRKQHLRHHRRYRRGSQDAFNSGRATLGGADRLSAGGRRPHHDIRPRSGRSPAPNHDTNRIDCHRVERPDLQRDAPERFYARDQGRIHEIHFPNLYDIFTGIGNSTALGTDLTRIVQTCIGRAVV